MAGFVVFCEVLAILIVGVGVPVAFAAASAAALIVQLGVAGLPARAVAA